LLKEGEEVSGPAGDRESNGNAETPNKVVAAALLELNPFKMTCARSASRRAIFTASQSNNAGCQEKTDAVISNTSNKFHDQSCHFRIGQRRW